jgi:hypothetical protein
MLNQYTNIEEIKSLQSPKRGERITDKTAGLLYDIGNYKYELVDLSAFYGSEIHIYSGENWITGDHFVNFTPKGNQILVDYRTRDAQGAITGDSLQLENAASYNLRSFLESQKISSGNYKFVINFFDTIFGNADNQHLKVDEISPDRTEIRLRAIDETNPHFLVAINQYINNIQQTSLNDDAHERYLLNFSRNETALFVNSVVVGKYLFVKLYEPISADIEKNFKCWIVRENKLPYIDNISITEIIQDITFNVISGVNWYASAEQNTSNATSLKNWNDLLGSSLQTSQQIIDSYFSGSLAGVKLNIDYTDFNNFIFYSSATERLANFKYKVELLEYYTAQSASIASQLSGSDARLNACTK